jgi:rubrerythrin
MQNEVGGRASQDEYVKFLAMGESAKGEFHCATCGYGVTVCRELPRCPICGGSSWEQTDWSPFMRIRQSL